MVRLSNRHGFECVNGDGIRISYYPILAPASLTQSKLAFDDDINGLFEHNLKIADILATLPLSLRAQCERILRSIKTVNKSQNKCTEHIAMLQFHVEYLKLDII